MPRPPYRSRVAAALRRTRSGRHPLLADWATTGRKAEWGAGMLDDAVRRLRTTIATYPDYRTMSSRCCCQNRCPAPRCINRTNDSLGPSPRGPNLGSPHWLIITAYPRNPTDPRPTPRLTRRSTSSIRSSVVAPSAARRQPGLARAAGYGPGIRAGSRVARPTR